MAFLEVQSTEPAQTAHTQTFGLNSVPRYVRTPIFLPRIEERVGAARRV